MGLAIYDYEYKKNGRPHGAHFTLDSRKFTLYADRLYIFTSREGAFLVRDGEEYHIPKRTWEKLKPRLVKAPVQKEQLARYERFYNMLLDKQFRRNLEDRFKKLADSLNCQVLPKKVTETYMLLTAQSNTVAVQVEINPSSCSVRLWSPKKTKFFGSELDKRFQRISKSLASMLKPFGYALSKPTKLSGLVFTEKTPKGKPYLSARGFTHE